MASKTRLELTWIGKEERPRLEPRILLEDEEFSHRAAKGYVVAETRGPHGGGVAAWSVDEATEAAEELEREYNCTTEWRTGFDCSSMESQSGVSGGSARTVLPLRAAEQRR